MVNADKLNLTDINVETVITMLVKQVKDAIGPQGFWVDREVIKDTAVLFMFGMINYQGAIDDEVYKILLRDSVTTAVIKREIVNIEKRQEEYKDIEKLVK